MSTSEQNRDDGMRKPTEGADDEGEHSYFILTSPPKHNPTQLEQNKGNGIPDLIDGSSRDDKDGPSMTTYHFAIADQD